VGIRITVNGGLYGYDIPIPQGKIYPEKTEVKVQVEYKVRVSSVLCHKWRFITVPFLSFDQPQKNELIVKIYKAEDFKLRDWMMR
jgi:hypothetical protein